MGREIKRVPLNFQWPIDKVWKGFINPYYVHCHVCESCNQTGYSPIARQYYDEWWGYSDYFKPEDNGSTPLTPETPAVKAFSTRNVDRNPEFYIHANESREHAIWREGARLCEHWNGQWAHHLNQDDVDALITSNALHEFTNKKIDDIPIEEYIRVTAYYKWAEAGSPYGQDGRFWNEALYEYRHFMDGGYWLPFRNQWVPTVKELNELSILSPWAGGSSWSYCCIKARCARNNVKVLCDYCEGNGSVWESPELEKKADEWEREEPPTGDAYQVWETVSEGSPISPPFLDARELAQWMVVNDTSITKDMTVDQWEKFILGPGWAPSMVMVDGKMQSGAEYIADRET